MTVWREDVLGAGFMCRTIPLGADDEGTLDATLVRAVPAAHAESDSCASAKGQGALAEQTERQQLGIGVREVASFVAGGVANAFATARKRFHVKHSSAWPAAVRGSDASTPNNQQANSTKADAASAAVGAGGGAAGGAASTAWENIDVLYVHGWSDYFFNTDLAHFFTERGARFYALDLRKYGRSLHSGQTPGYIEDLGSYDTEISAAISIIRADEHGLAAARQSTVAKLATAWRETTQRGATQRGAAKRDKTRTEQRDRLLLLLGHSTGGLVLSLWAADHPGQVDGVLLDAPWLEFQLRGAGRQLLSPIVELGAKLHPREVAPQLDFGFYTRAQNEVGPRHLLRNINEEWRPPQTHAVANGWLNAVLTGHSRVAHGLGIEVPVGVLLSDKSLPPVKWSDELTSADTVLDVEAVAQAALRLGDRVTVMRIRDALHDVYLSADAPRALAYQRTAEWVTAWQMLCSG